MTDRDPPDSLALTTLDPVTGEWSDVLLRYVVHKGRYYLLGPSAPPPKWILRAPETIPIWHVSGTSLSGGAEIVEDEELLETEIVPLFIAKYGRRQFARWFGANFVCLALTPSGPSNGRLYASVERLFDTLSEHYDKRVEDNPFDRHLREKSLSFLLETFKRGDRLLELGCGTGLETIPLAQHGIDVVALDISDAMLRKLDRKAISAGVRDKIVLRKLPAGDLGVVLDECGPGYFDGAFSDFGAMNTEPNWRAIPRLLYDLVRPQGIVVLAVWNRTCLIEMSLYALHLNFRRAFSRLRSPVPVGLSRFGVPVLAFGVSEFEQPFSHYFVREKILGLPVILPPYDLGGRLPNPGRFLHLFEPLDGFLHSRFPFNRLGDHFLLKLRRR